MKKETKQINDYSEEEVKMLNQLHIAEYNALTMRHTYLITLQYGMISIAIVFLTFIGSIWNKLDLSIYIWTTFFGVQLFALVVISNIYEINNLILYMENDLRNQIMNVFENNRNSTSTISKFDFWKFEYYQSRGRNAFISRYLELILLAILLIIFLIIVVYFYPLKSKFDYIAFGVNLSLLVVISINALKINKVRNLYTGGNKKLK